MGSAELILTMTVLSYNGMIGDLNDRCYCQSGRCKSHILADVIAILLWDDVIAQQYNV